MKKLIAIFLSLAMIFALCACNNQASTPTQPAASNTPSSSETENPGSEQTPGATIDYPTKKISLIVPYDAGGVNDVPARLTVETMNKFLAQPIEVVNIPGSAGTIGGNEVKIADADGYTLLVAPPGYALQYALGTCPFTYEDFRPICVFAETYQCIVVTADSPYETLDDLVDAAKAAPGQIKIGAVTGTLPVFSALALESQRDIDVNIVDMELTAKASELLSGRIDAYFDSIGSVTQYLEGGQFRCLGIIAEERMESLPDIPTFKEMGFTGLEFLRQMFAIWAPAGTPDEVCAVIEDAVRQAVEDPANFEALNATNNFPCYIDHDAYMEMLPQINQSYADYAKSVLG